MKLNSCLFATVFGVAFFVASFLTLRHYGVSWDEALHFRRGQAYLHYFLTGKTSYDDLPTYNLQGTKGDPQNVPVPRRSFYQNDFHNGEFFLKKDSGHPPINGELAALSNFVFFQKLGVLDDISAHHLFNIAASSLLVFVVVAFASETFGRFAATVSFLSLVTYPLFWAESHFNVKDPPEVAFFAATVWAFYKSLRKGGAGWLFASLFFFALALGTKFNVLFLPFIIFPYLFFRFGKSAASLRNIVALPKKHLLALVSGLLVVTVVFVGTWPFLWQNWPENFLSIISFYKEIGIGHRYQPDNFFVFGFNTYPTLWTLFTSSPFFLFFFAVGVYAAWKHKDKHQGVTVLWLLWFVVPLLRVSIPGTVVYGGIRQILEFLPAMALLSGVGAWQVIKWSSWRRFTAAAAVLAFLWPTFILFKMHPNENVYFNFLIGGLPGAKERNFPSWGNSFGNAYLQGIRWVNQNVEVGAKLALIQGTTANVPEILLRADIDYKKAHWSGVERDGEYLMELTFADTTRSPIYAWEYVEKFLEPVYELTVGDVPILKVWKNDLKHTRLGYRLKEKLHTMSVHIWQENNFLNIELEEPVVLSRLKFSWQPDGCSLSGDIFVESSLDDANWTREKDWIPFAQVRGKSNLEGNAATFFFAARQVKYVRIVAENKTVCALTPSDIQIIVFE